MTRWHRIGLLVLIFVLAVAIRNYHLYQDLFFGFEQGRDASIIRNIAQLKDFTLVGPKTDIGGVFHGAWYYYLMTIPFLIGQGNPYVLALFLVFLTSLTTIVMYAWMSEMTRSRLWGYVAALLTAVSYDAITYSRWISNVTPALLCVPLAFWCMWRFRTTKKSLWFIFATIAAVLAMQFEIVLILLFSCALLALLVFRLIPFPTPKTLLISTIVVFFAFSPMLVFNFRNQNIVINSALGYIRGTSDHKRAFDPWYGTRLYVKHQFEVFKKTLIYTKEKQAYVVYISVFIFALMLTRKTKTHEPGAIPFLLVMLLMSAPTILFSDITDLSQMYIGQGLAYIGLLTIACAALAKIPKAKLLLIPLAIASIVHTGNTLNALDQKLDIYFQTIQDDLNYTDQRALLTWVHEDAAGQPYRFDAFTIPYFQPHGWLYLKSYLYPQDNDRDARVKYIVVEEKVAPFWEEMWIGDLGKTTVLVEKKFGRIRVKKLSLDDL